MQRVLVVGSGGAGKSTLARELGARLGLPVIHLDVYYWRPGWVARDSDEWAARVADLAAGDRWVIDGNFNATVPIRLARADTVVFLDLPRLRCLARVFRRWLRYRGSESRPDLPTGCPEGLDAEFLRWVWSFPGAPRQELLEAIERQDAGGRLIRLRSPRAVRRWLASIPVDQRP